MEQPSLYPAGHKGLEYVKACLEQGGELASYLLSHDFCGENAFVIGPAGLSDATIFQFEQGGAMSSADSLRWISEHIKTSYSRIEDSYFVIYDMWGRRDDPVQIRNPRSIYSETGGVYFIIPCHEICSEKLLDCMKKISGFMFAGVVVTLPSMKLALFNRLLSDSDIRLMAARAREVIVPAYDQEGFVILKI